MLSSKTVLFVKIKNLSDFCLKFATEFAWITDATDEHYQAGLSQALSSGQLDAGLILTFCVAMRHLSSASNK